MTTQEKLQLITQDIREKLPRLMQLGEGCSIEGRFGSGDDKYFGIWQILGIENHKKGYIYPIITKKQNNHYTTSFLFSFDFEEEGKVKIIGREPVLTDVLEWLSILNSSRLSTEVILTTRGEFFEDKVNDEAYIALYYDVKWDLCKFKLKDQDDKVINLLYYFYEQNKLNKK